MLAHVKIKCVLNIMNKYNSCVKKLVFTNIFQHNYLLGFYSKPNYWINS